MPSPSQNIIINSKKSVSEDENINKLLHHDFDIVISSSGLKRLTNFIENTGNWDLPVIIKEVQVEPRVKRKIVYIDKPLPKKQPNVNDFCFKCHKQLIRMNFCQYEAFR